MRKIGVYGIVAKHEDLIYVGSSRHCIDKRWSNHKSKLRKNIFYYCELQDIWNDNSNNLEFVVLEEIENIEELADAEWAYMNYFEEMGWNVINYSDVYKVKPIYSEQTKMKMSVKQRGQGNPRARLTDDEVREIKWLIEKKVSFKTIAEHFKITVSQVGNISSGYRWRYVS
jgi:hypothetical protein